MRLDRRRRRFDLGGHVVEASRTGDGVAVLRAETENGLACALGAAHALDRLVQMELARIVGRGRVAELLVDTDASVAIDRLMRSLGLSREAENEAAGLDDETRRWAAAYAAGVNHVLDTGRRPFELLLLRHRPEPWTVADTLATIKLMSYFGLAQSQQDAEKLIIQTIHNGGPVDALQRLFAPHLDGLDPEITDAIRKLRHLEPLLPTELRFEPTAPKSPASNAWAVAGDRTSSGLPILCCDPHLECNRLPPIWYEAVLATPDSHRLGITMPGVPGLVMGRTDSLAFGFTYGFMDMVDYFVEDVVDGRCRRGDTSIGLETRHETIERKSNPALGIFIHENDLGVLETDGSAEVPADGIYLTRAWSAHRAGAASSLRAIRRLPSARTVVDAQAVLRDVAISCNWVLADRQGSIGYQQSGLLPDRRHSGVHPVPAWDTDSGWRGFIPGDRLHSELDPSDGMIVSANNEVNPPHGPLVVNLPMGSYRHDRIRELLEAENRYTPQTMQPIQTDLRSLQAERLLEIWRPLLPDSLAGRMLARWDCRYDTASRGATLFESVYHDLLARIIGDRVFGREAWYTIADETAILADYFHLFDRVLLGDEPYWWGEAGREGRLTEIFAELLTHLEPYRVVPWGRRHQTTMTNIFFRGKLPGFLGFDHGPIEMPGNRATVIQGGLFTAHGRETTFAPSWRFITDLGDDEAFTVLAGGPSGSRFSRWYTTDVRRWLKGEYKRLRLENQQSRVERSPEARSDAEGSDALGTRWEFLDSVVELSRSE